MAWNDPNEVEWDVGDILTSQDLKDYVRDNLLALKDPPSAHYEVNESSDLSLTATSWDNVDATEGKFQHTLSTNGGALLVGLNMVLGGGNGDRVYLDIAVDGTRIGGNEGIHAILTTGVANPIDGSGSFVRLIPDLPAGTHIIKLQYKVAAGPITLFRGAGAGAADFIPQFWVREVS